MRIGDTIELGEQGVLYFVQCVATGSIKAGFTAQPVNRMASLQALGPRGTELLATVPGCRYREQALHYALSPFRLRGEWYRPAAEVWRVVIEAMDARDLSWLPTASHPVGRQEPLWTEAVEYFGDIQGVTSALHFAGSATLSMGHNASPSFWGAFRMEQAIRRGVAPAFLRPAGLAMQPRRAQRAA